MNRSRIPVERFTFTDSGVYCAEISGIGLTKPLKNGITLVLVGHLGWADFDLQVTVCDGDGDVRYWILFPTSDSMQQHPSMVGCKMEIFND